MTYFSAAYHQACIAFQNDEVPVGAVIIRDGVMIASQPNRMRQKHDGTAHAELLCIQEASQKLGTQHLTDCDIYVTVEPCSMCAGAIANARIRRVFFGAYDQKGGGVDHGARVFEHTLHKPQVIGGIEEIKCAQLMRDFFKQKR
ncbi:MAG: nucleoside deaminase [Candidatus Paracaedibacteraceae bacterium]|nr:nucleoside deaminase [Candidatus Paracaedibacteraceae bacterium]